MELKGAPAAETAEEVPLRPFGISPEVAAQLSMTATVARFEAIRTEIQWRGIQRDAMVIFAFTVLGVVFGSINTVGMWILLAPIPITYLAAMWLHHDRRIGSLARYLLDQIEPAMKKHDALLGLEEYLDAFETARKSGSHFSAIMSRLLFPTLQLAASSTGVGIFIANGPSNSAVVGLVIVAAVIALTTIIFTFKKVKHIRIR